MKLKANIHLALTALTAAAIAAPTVLAAGEPKNELPFTRHVTITAPRSTEQATSGVAEMTIAGEPKNEPPFTRRVNSGPALNGTREVTAGTAPRALQFLVIGDGATAGQTLRVTSALKDAKAAPAANRYQAARNSV